jgi:hypothetical protein
MLVTARLRAILPHSRLVDQRVAAADLAADHAGELDDRLDAGHVQAMVLTLGHRLQVLHHVVVDIPILVVDFPAMWDVPMSVVPDVVV